MRALLFDLDGTLTKSGGAGVRALCSALHARPQAAEELSKMRLDGMTDRAIARTLLAAEGDQAVPVEKRARQVAEADIDRVLERYLEALAAECARNAYTALPGVAALLERLAQRGDALLGLCTGNVARGAAPQLTSGGVGGRFPVRGHRPRAEPPAAHVCP